jgi:O-antigen/teichoic acid export membrane protein
MNRPGQVVKNISFNWISMAIAMVFGFVQSPIVVKGLGNTWFGIWVLVNQIVSYTWLFDLGIREAIVRYVSKYHALKEFHTVNEILSGAIHLYLFISFLTIIAVSAVTILLPHIFVIEQGHLGVARLVLFVSGMNIAINWFFNSYVGILMGLQRFDIFQKIGMGMGTISFVLIISFIKAGYGIIALSLVNFATSMVSNALVYWNCRRLLPDLKLVHYDRKKINIKLFINYGKYVFLNNIGSKIVTGTDGLIIAIFMHVSAITFYAIPATLVNMLKNILSSATSVMNPLFSELEATNNMGKIKTIFTSATKLSFLMALPVGIVYLFMGKNFISLWMGESYGPRSFSVLIILTLGTLFTVWENVINSLLYGISHHHIIAWLRSLEAATIIVLCISFIKTWGIVGVALGNTLPHMLFIGIILPIMACRDLKISTSTYVLQSILPPIASSLPFALCCYVVNLYMPAKHITTFFLHITLIMPVFLACSWYMAFTKAERKTYAKIVLSYIPARRLFGRKNDTSV